MSTLRYLIPTIILYFPALAMSCGGPSAAGLAALPTPVTRATLAGPLCEGDACRCREPGDDPATWDAGTPAPGAGKRYELRLGPVSNALWLTVDGMVLYKSEQQAEACFYLDLPPGQHPVRLQAQGEPGFDARLSIAEMRPTGTDPYGDPLPADWYHTFDFSCGAPGHCDLDQLDDWRASLARYRRQVHDPCGSTRIRGLSWQTGDAPDRLHPTALQLDLALDVHEFAPEHGPGHPACADRY